MMTSRTEMGTTQPNVRGRSEAAEEWRCFHCDEVFTDKAEARDHFGADETATPACRIGPRDKGLLEVLRRTEGELATWRMRALLLEEKETSAELVRADYGRYFQGSKSPWEAFCLLDSMEGRRGSHGKQGEYGDG